MGQNIPDPGAAGLNIPDLLARLTRRIRAEARHDLGPLGITPAQMRALRTLGGGADALRMSDLADRLGIVKRSATDVVAGLVDRGLVRRGGDSADRRAVLLHITPAGRSLLDVVAERRRDAAERLVGVLTAAERDQLGRLLRRVIDAPGPDGPGPASRARARHGSEC